jgi:hypothetical protein
MATPIEIMLLDQLKALAVQLKAAGLVVPPGVSAAIEAAEGELANPITGFEETLSRVAALGAIRNINAPLRGDYCETPFACSLLDHQIALWIGAEVDFDYAPIGLDGVVERVLEKVWELRPDGFDEMELIDNPKLVAELIGDWRIEEVP